MSTIIFSKDTAPFCSNVTWIELSFGYVDGIMHSATSFCMLSATLAQALHNSLNAGAYLVL